MMRPSPATAIGAVIVTEMADLTRLLAMRRYELGLSQTDCDTATGWADGYAVGEAMTVLAKGMLPGKCGRMTVSFSCHPWRR